VSDRPRRAPNLTEKLAAALLTIARDDGAGKLVRVISHDEAKKLTPAQILERFRFDHHPVRFVDRDSLPATGIPYIHHPANLTPLPTPEHEAKTAEIDLPQIAKRKRIVKAGATTSPELDKALSALLPKQRTVRDAMIEAGIVEDRPGRYRWPKRSFPQGRKLQSRPFRRQP
jgi:hypothetical protein